MGLFFDQDWFDARLSAKGLKRSALAQATGMTIDEVEMVFRDQRELEGREVQAIARMLSVEPREVANRSGASEPLDSDGPFASAAPMRMSSPQQPEFQVTREVIAGLHERIDRVERLIEMVLAKLDKLQR